MRKEQGGEPEAGRHRPSACISSLLQIGLHQMLLRIPQGRKGLAARCCAGPALLDKLSKEADTVSWRGDEVQPLQRGEGKMGAEKRGRGRLTISTNGGPSYSFVEKLHRGTR